MRVISLAQINEMYYAIYDILETTIEAFRDWLQSLDAFLCKNLDEREFMPICRTVKRNNECR
jgi:hypothetical protein